MMKMSTMIRNKMIMRKKNYICPATKAVDIETQQLMAGSGQIESGKTDGKGDHSLPANAKHGNIDWE